MSEINPFHTAFLGEDDESYRLHHPELGHFSVAKDGINDDTKSVIESLPKINMQEVHKMAFGGMDTPMAGGAGGSDQTSSGSTEVIDLTHNPKKSNSNDGSNQGSWGGSSMASIMAKRPVSSELADTYKSLGLSIPGMADGGEVDNSSQSDKYYTPANPEQSSGGDSIMSSLFGSPSAGAALPPPEPSKPELNALQKEYNNQVLATGGDQSAMIKDPSTKPENLDLAALDAAKNIVKSRQSSDEATTIRSKKQQAASQQGLADLGFAVQPPAPAGKPVLGGDQPTGGSITPKAAVPEANQPQDLMHQALDAQRLAAFSQYAGQMGLSRDQAAAFANTAKNYQDIENSTNQEMALRQLRQEQLKKAIMNQSVDPNRFWKNKSTLSKVMAMMGVALNGFGSGLLKSNKNLALEMINDAVDKDIQEQKTELGKAENLLSIHMRETGDYLQAQQRAKADLLEHSKLLLEAAAAKANNPTAAAIYMNTIGQLNSQQYNAEYEMAKKNALMQASIGQPIQNPEMLDEKDRERMVKLPNNMGFLPTSSKEERDKLQDTLTHVDTANTAANDLDRLIPKEGTINFHMPLIRTEYKQEAKDASERAQLAVINLFKSNRLSEIQRDYALGLIPKADDWRSDIARVKLNGFRKFIQGVTNSELSNHISSFRGVNMSPANYAEKKK